MSDWTVVKVGGSLFNLPDLGSRLHGWISRHMTGRILIVPGGGGLADAIRTLDQTHNLGEEAAHWLAIQTLSINAHFLQRLLPGSERIAKVSNLQSVPPGCCILDAYSFFLADETRDGRVPHVWQATSDSLALRAAILAEARDLVLLKSIDWQGEDWEAAGRQGVVDAYFARLAQTAAENLRIRVVNLRSWSEGGQARGAERGSRPDG